MIGKALLAGQFLERGLALLAAQDPVLMDLIERECQRQNQTLCLLAASSIADPSVLFCEASAASNVTAEGYPGRRFHAGCGVVDEIECLAVERARLAFGARYANVQPHSGTSANQIVLFGLLRPGDMVLGLDLSSGGHLTHGARASVTGHIFNTVHYGLTAAGRIDYDQVEDLARRFHPRLIVAGASSYPRTIDFKVFREIADRAGAWLLADISHIAGLVAAGLHPNPIDHAHFTTTSTYKQLFGPRGGLILMGAEADTPMQGRGGTLSEMIQRATFPLFQGTPRFNGLAAKARALARVTAPEFRALAQRIVVGAASLAEFLAGAGFRLQTGGTDNHLVLLDLTPSGLSGLVAERALEECGIVANRNLIAGDRRAPAVASGLRLGSNTLALRGMGSPEFQECAALITQTLSSLEVLGDTQYRLDPLRKRAILAAVENLCERFPIPGYPIGGARNAG